MSRFQGVLFDCDGVLVDSEPITIRVLRDYLEECGWAMSQQDCHDLFLGKAVIDEQQQIEAETGQPITPQWMEAYRIRRNDALMAELQAVRHVHQAVHAIHDAYQARVAVASGADQHKIEIQLHKVGLHRYFEGRIFSGHNMPRSKPHPDVYLAAAASIQVDPKHCAVVEDSLVGLRAGVAAGATVFAYVPEGDGRLHLEAGAAHVFQDMADLPGLLA
jgi:HAD superfamily hydrolase (TIGR01509 family)